MASVGYAFLRESLGLSAFQPLCPAVTGPVTRLQVVGNTLSVPRHVAPENDQPLAHVLFALKHEGTNLQILAEVLPKISAEEMLSELVKAPTGAYIRLACFLWEQFANRELELLAPVGGNYHFVFDPERYVTGPPVRHAKWRVAFNGLGTMQYCATVRRTPAIDAAIQSNLLDRTKEFIDSLGREMMDRALSWAYLHETDSSFAIEREAPTEDKSRQFVELLKQAHEPRALDEEYLVELQNVTITNPFDKAAAFRFEQNWLSGPGRGAMSVTYVPPPSALAVELMAELISFASTAPRAIDPVVAASIVSFGFVFIHPFMDGNGRLSRFLFHHALCQSGRLERGLLLPVSVAMKRHEADYLSVLQAYSRPARQCWSVRYIDEGQFDFAFRGADSIYRFWDATSCVEFGYRMAEEALEIELRQETEFLAAYDRVVRAVNDRFDVRGSDLATLVRCCLDNHNVLSKHRRKQYAARVPEAAMDLIESEARAARAEVPPNDAPEPDEASLDDQAEGSRL
jgi:hypothetical protein